MATVAELVRDGAGKLDSVSGTSRLDAELLLARVLDRDRTWLFTWPDHEVPLEDERRFLSLLEERAAGRPVAWLLGEREFFGHIYRVTPDTLIPRPETELLVEVVLRLLPEAGQRIVDLGAGTGAVGISLALARPGWRVLLGDLHVDTLAVASENALRLGAENVRTVLSDWLREIDGELDAVISNPPYVPEQDPHLQEGDVQFEPRRALVAGVDGLDAIRAILRQSAGKLKPGGLLALEHGYDQGAAVRDLLTDAGFVDVATEKDLAGHDRVTHGRRNAQ